MIITTLFLALIAGSSDAGAKLEQDAKRAAIERLKARYSNSELKKNPLFSWQFEDFKSVDTEFDRYLSEVNEQIEASDSVAVLKELRESTAEIDSRKVNSGHVANVTRYLICLSEVVSSGPLTNRMVSRRDELLAQTYWKPTTYESARMFLFVMARYNSLPFYRQVASRLAARYPMNGAVQHVYLRSLFINLFPEDAKVAIKVIEGMKKLNYEPFVEDFERGRVVLYSSTMPRDTAGLARAKKLLIKSKTDPDLHKSFRSEADRLLRMIEEIGRTVSLSENTTTE